MPSKPCGRHAKATGHELTVTLPPQPLYLHADPARLAQVIGNLLNNAYKFTPHGGRVRLAVAREDGQDRYPSAR